MSDCQTTPNATATDPTNTFEQDFEAFQTIQATLVGEHKGKYVLVKNGVSQGIFSNFEDAHKEALRLFGNEDVVIGMIGVDPPLNYVASVV
jgi:hypothetical protein